MTRWLLSCKAITPPLHSLLPSHYNHPYLGDKKVFLSSVGIWLFVFSVWSNSLKYTQSLFQAISRRLRRQRIWFLFQWPLSVSTMLSIIKGLHSPFWGRTYSLLIFQDQVKMTCIADFFRNGGTGTHVPSKFQVKLPFLDFGLHTSFYFSAFTLLLYAAWHLNVVNLQPFPSF